MQRQALKSPRGGIALATTLLVLFILAVIAFAICAVGIRNLGMVGGYRNASMAYYAARAGITEAFYRIDNDNSYGTSSSDSFTETLSNTQAYTVNFVSGPFYSVNNIAGSGSVNDGSGDSIPKKFVSVISSSTVRGRTVRLKGIGRLGYPGGDYAIFTDGTDDAAAITGDLRNNYTGSDVGMAFSSITGTATTTAGSGSISGSGGSRVYHAGSYPVPDLQVANIVSAAASRPGVYTPATLPDPLDGLLHPITYIEGDVTMNGGFTIRNGAILFVNGNFTVNGSQLLEQILEAEGTSTSRCAIFCTGNFRANGASCTNSLSIVAGGSIQFSGAADLRGFMYCNTSFEQNGNSNYTGNIMVRGGNFAAAGTNVVYDPRYMEALGQFFPPELVRVRILTMGQI